MYSKCSCTTAKEKTNPTIFFTVTVPFNILNGPFTRTHLKLFLKWHLFSDWCKKDGNIWFYYIGQITQLLTFLPVVWHISNCSDHDQDPNQRQVHKTYAWDGNHWEQVKLLSHSSFILLSHIPWLLLSGSAKRGYKVIHKVTVWRPPSLHSHLVEHLNAEIVLQTISDVNMALDWIRSTLLYIRALKNPAHYGQSSKGKRRCELMPSFFFITVF